MTPIAIVPPSAVLLYPVEIAPGIDDPHFRAYNVRVRQFNKGRLR